MNKVNNEEHPEYKVEVVMKKEDYDNSVISNALSILEEHMTKPDSYITCPMDTMNYLRLKLLNKPNEVFSVIFLDNRHGIIKYEELFTGTIDTCSVYPRVVAKRALELNAAAIIMAHNHPSGVSSPSEQDKNITKRIKQALELFDIRTIDHVIIGNGTTSMAELGLL